MREPLCLPAPASGSRYRDSVMATTGHTQSKSSEVRSSREHAGRRRRERRRVARPDGWWKDRAGAARRLHEQLLLADLGVRRGGARARGRRQGRVTAPAATATSAPSMRRAHGDDAIVGPGTRTRSRRGRGSRWSPPTGCPPGQGRAAPAPPALGPAWLLDQALEARLEERCVPMAADSGRRTMAGQRVSRVLEVGSAHRSDATDPRRPCHPSPPTGGSSSRGHDVRRRRVPRATTARDGPARHPPPGLRRHRRLRPRRPVRGRAGRGQRDRCAVRRLPRGPAGPAPRRARPVARRSPPR